MCSDESKMRKAIEAVMNSYCLQINAEQETQEMRKARTLVGQVLSEGAEASTLEVKKAELTGRALDWAVSKALGHEPTHDMVSHGVTWHGWYERNPFTAESLQYRQLPFYATSWKHAGPIIEREKILIAPPPNNAPTEHKWWYAQKEKDTGFWCGKGLTPIIAAMRCLVAAKLGDEVEIPEQLIEEQKG